MRTTDNNCGIKLDELLDPTETYDLDDLKCIANIKINEIKLEEYPNLLVFPNNWNDFFDDIHTSEILSLTNDNKIKTGNIMGFIGVNKTNLTITSRFASKDKKDFFLHYMLQKVFAINVLNLQTSGGKEDICDFLVFFFPYFLNKALSQGLYKEYKHNEYNDANIRGIIDVKRHLRINIPFVGKVAYSTREYSYDNPVMQIIRHTIEYIKSDKYAGLLTRDTDTNKNINQIMLTTQNYNRNDRQKIINLNKKKPVIHPYFTEYKSLQRLCIRILCNEKISTSNEKEKIHGILFDGAWLWEEYLNTILAGKGFEHPRNKRKEGGYPLFSDSGEIYPDFVKESEPSIIADAKYKHLEKDIDRLDYYQLMAYMYRFNSNRGYLLFPHIGNFGLKKNWILKGFNKDKVLSEKSENEIILLGMNIPQNKSIPNDFKEAMEDSEKKLLNEIQ
jgi:5-methylcytosine-specific restriction endonuclease McrBC regulatory subunit McrC